MAKVIDTFNTSLSDYAELTYWFTYRNPKAGYRDDNNQYLADVHNPHSGTFFPRVYGVASQPMYTRQFWGDFKRDAEMDTWGKRQAIDCTIYDQTLNITKISKIGDRDYVLDIDTGYSQYQYAMPDCNHYQHAFNRFAKRVREEINPRLGTEMTVVDARPKEQPVQEWPDYSGNLTEEQRVIVRQWAQKNNQLLSIGCYCTLCSNSYKNFLKEQRDAAQRQMPYVGQPGFDAKSSVEEVVSLVENIVQENSVPPIYTMHISISASAYIEVCGDSDVLGLIRKAQEIVTAFDLATPNVVILIRDRNGTGVARITEEEGVTIF